MVPLAQISLPKPNSELAIIERPSSVDLVLAQKLDEMAQIHNLDLLPGGTRIWKLTFWKEKPEALAWGFRQYYRDGSSFPPKPQDIARLIRMQRESPYFDGWDEDIR